MCIPEKDIPNFPKSGKMVMKAKGLALFKHLLEQNKAEQQLVCELKRVLASQLHSEILVDQRRFHVDGKKLTITPTVFQKKFNIRGPRRKTFLEKCVRVEEDLDVGQTVHIKIPEYEPPEKRRKQEETREDCDMDRKVKLAPVIPTFPYGFREEEIPLILKPFLLQ